MRGFQLKSDYCVEAALSLHLMDVKRSEIMHFSAILVSFPVQFADAKKHNKDKHKTYSTLFIDS